MNKYRYIEKTKSELESEKIINNLCLTLWKDSGYATAYYLGAINQLKVIASALKQSSCLTKEDTLMLIANYKKDNNAPDEIIDLIDAILEEFNYKEN